MRLLTILLLCISINVNATHTVYIGSTGGGAISVNNLLSTYGVSGGDTIRVKTGVYTFLDFSNTNVTGSVPLYILPSDTGVTFTVCCGGFSILTAVSNCYFGAFKFYNGAFRGLVVEGDSDSLTFKGTVFKSLPDYGVYFHGLTYDGTEATRNDYITFDGCTFDSLYSAGNCILMQNNTKFLTIKNCILKNTITTTADCVGLFFADKVEVHDNSFTDINLTGTSHNAVIYLKGNGNVYRNYASNVQGDFIRASSYLIDSSATNQADTVWIYLNREVGSRKYAMVEFQQFFTDTTTGSGIPNVKTGTWVAANNSACNLRTADYSPWSNSSGGGGSMFDRYQVYKNMIIVNNKSWRLYIDSVPNPASPPPAFTFNYMFHVGGGTNPSWIPNNFGDTSNNVYSIDAAAAGIADTLVMNITPFSVGAFTGTSRFSYKFTSDYRNILIRIWMLGASAALLPYWIHIKPFNTKQLN